MNNEIILFETNDKSVRLPVQVDTDTVWLTQGQMSELFSTTKQNVSLHINNCFREGELDRDSVVKDSLTTASDGKMYSTKYYSLDVIISVGYRVKSHRGVEFRKWATSVLKQYDPVPENRTNRTSSIAEFCRITSSFILLRIFVAINQGVEKFVMTIGERVSNQNQV